jgi:hypothetical protein
MQVFRLLQAQTDQIVREAAAALRQRIKRFAEAEPVERTENRYREYYQLIIDSLGTRDVGPLLEWSRGLAERQYAAGAALYEAQTAINAMEEVLWRQLLAALDPAEFAQAIGGVSTVLGMSKDAVARSYVALVSKQHAASLNQSALFSGTQTGEREDDEA